MTDANNLATKDVSRETSTEIDYKAEYERVSELYQHAKSGLGKKKIEDEKLIVPSDISGYTFDDAESVKEVEKMFGESQTKEALRDFKKILLSAGVPKESAKKLVDASVRGMLEEKKRRDVERQVKNEVEEQSYTETLRELFGEDHASSIQQYSHLLEGVNLSKKDQATLLKNLKKSGTTTIKNSMKKTAVAPRGMTDSEKFRKMVFGQYETGGRT